MSSTNFLVFSVISIHVGLMLEEIQLGGTDVTTKLTQNQRKIQTLDETVFTSKT